MDPTQNAWTQRKKLILMLVLAAVSIVLGGYYAYSRETAAVRDQKYRELSAIASAKVESIVEWRNERMENARATASEPFLQAAILALMASGAPGPLRGRILEALGSQRDLYRYANVIVAHTDGSVALSVNSELTELGTDSKRLVAQAVASRDVVLGDFSRCETSSRVYLDVAAPLLDKDRRPAAVLILQLDPEVYLYPLVRSWPTSSRTVETYLIRRDGDFALYLNRLRDRSEAPLTLRVPLSQSERPAVRAALGQLGRFQGTDRRGARVLAEVQPVPGSSWRLVAKVPAAEILAEADYRARIILIFVSVAIFVATVLARLVWLHRERNQFKRLFEAERREREIQGEFRATLYGIGDGVIATDPAGCITRMNPAAEELTGWSESEALGKPLAHVFKILNEETRRGVENAVDRVMRENGVAGLANHTILLSRNGVERPVADSGAPIRDESGKVKGVVLVFSDQTEERRRRKALEESEERFRAVFEQAAVGVVQVETDTGRFLRVNQRYADIVGYSREELESLDFQSLTHPDHLASDLANMQRLIAGEVGEMSWEKRYIRKDGAVVWAKLTVSVIRTQGRRPDSYVTVAEDITARKRAEEKLNESEKRLRRIVEASPFPAMVHAEDGEILLVNPAWTQLSGYLLEDIPTIEEWTSRAYGERRETVKQHMRRLYDLSGMAPEGDDLITTADGRQRIWDLYAGPLGRDDRGRRLLLSTAFDVTERRAVEEALARSEEWYRGLFEHMSEGFALCKMLFESGQPVDFVYIAVNQAFETLTGLKDVTGKRVTEVIPGIREKDPELLEIYGRVALTGKPEKFEMFVEALKMWFFISVYSPEKEHFVAVFDVVNDRKKAEAELRASEEKFSKTFRHAPLMMAIRRLEDGMILDVNERFESLLGFRREELIGKNSVEIGLLSAEDDSRWVQALLEEPRAPGLEIPVRTKDGTPLICERRGGLINLAGTVCILSTLVDTTERKRHEAERETALNMLRLLNAPNDLDALIREVAAFLQKRSGCDAVGVRVQNGDDYPYHEARGFSPAFVSDENRLCLPDKCGQTVRDGEGNPVLECMCGNVICGRFNPKLPFFTESGSFWTNSTSELLASTEADRQWCARNRCNSEGYESVMLIPLRTGGRTLGLLQFNDRRKGQFDPDKIALLERTASALAVAVGQRLTEAALRKSEQSLRQLAETLPQQVWTCAPDGQCDYLGPQWLAYTGKPEASHLGYGWVEQLHPDDRKRASERFVTAARAAANFDDDVRIRRHDGTFRWFKTRAVPLKDEQGRVVRWFGTNTDIEESKVAEEQLRRRMEELATVMDVVPIAIWVGHDPECQYITGNRMANEFMEAEAGENVSATNTSGRRYFQNGRECTAEELPMQYSVRHNVDVREAEFDLMAPSGARRTLWGYVRRLRHADGSTRGSVGAFMDITEAKRTETALRESEEKFRTLNAELEQRIRERTVQLEVSNKELEAFAYSVSHDLRAPLRALDGFSAALLSEYPEKFDAQGRHYLKRIQAASLRMGQLISDLLDLSRVTRYELTRKELDLSRMARKVAAGLQAQDPDRRSEFRIAAGLVVEGDPHLLRIALENLLGNAWKFTRDTPTASIEVGTFEQDGERIHFVRDNGVGFNMAYAHKLFAAFQRLHSVSEFPGTGIGLATVQRIVARHGGRIWPEAAVNRGATFYFTLGGK